MLKRRKYGGLITLALLALIVWMVVSSQREPDHVKLALEQIPAACTPTGTWRSTDYPEAAKHMRHTLIICTQGPERYVWTVFDDASSSPFSVQLDDAGHALGTTADTYTVNADGSLTISDEQGVFLHLPPN